MMPICNFLGMLATSTKSFKAIPEGCVQQQDTEVDADLQHYKKGGGEIGCLPGTPERQAEEESSIYC
jgi:hypothetical protein